MFRTLLLVVVMLLVMRAVWRLLGGIVQGAISTGPASPGRGAAAPSAVKMERDPVCGTFVIPGKALEITRGQERLYFCSDRCRDEWRHAH